MSKIARLISIIDKNPRLDAISLKGKGWKPNIHGSLRDAEKAGILEYRNGGWYVSSDMKGRAKDHAMMMGYPDASDMDI